MEDQAIINLYFSRSENAVRETKAKYGRMLRSIAFGILKIQEDAEECENDTYLKTWYSIPPARPDVFSAFLSRIARNLSLDRFEYLHALKRGSGEIPLLLDELEECIIDGREENHAEEEALKELLNHFLARMKKDARVIFMRRYWFGDSVAEIADRTGTGKSRVKMSLMRSRRELKELLEKEGYAV